MQMTRYSAGRIVGRERVLFAVEREFSVSDPVAIAPDQAAEIRRFGPESCSESKPSTTSADFPVAIRYVQTHDDSTVVGDDGAHS